MDAWDDLIVTLAGVCGLLHAHQPCAICSLISSHSTYLLYLLLPNSSYLQEMSEQDLGKKGAAALGQASSACAWVGSTVWEALSRLQQVEFEGQCICGKASVAAPTCAMQQQLAEVQPILKCSCPASSLAPHRGAWASAWAALRCVPCCV
jgi:hypothetical protein